MSSFRSYITGFVSSLIFTFTAYVLVVNQVFQGSMLLTSIIVLALIQFVVQLICFLHIGSETGERWNLITFISTISVVLIVVVGAVWIMYHLNYNMTPSVMNNYLIQNEGMTR